jgi:predicted ribosomally synthesized peptide with SipW-like signal peptide
MKAKNKALLLTLCAVLLAAASILGTMAYLTDSKEVVNTFTVGKVKITLDEAIVDAETGKVLTGEGAGRTASGNEKVKMIPGRVVDKDPTVTVKAGSEQSYVRMFVTLNFASQLQAIFGADFLPENFVSGWDRNVWQCVAIEPDTTANTLTYEFRYVGTANAGTRAGTVQATVAGGAGGEGEDIRLQPLFTTFTMPGTVTGEQLATLVTDSDRFTISLRAEAIQAEGFADANAAWAEFVAPAAP